MKQSSSAPARVIAALAVACGFLVVAAIVVGSLDGGDDGSGSGQRNAAQHGEGGAHVPKSYVVQSGDTLTSIAHRTGVPVARIVALNPGIDPQILVSGERLKLR
jgi:LysM repeat protein